MQIILKGVIFLGIGHDNNEYQSVIEKLRAIIEIESEKPADKMDADLVEECVDFLMELENEKGLKQEEIDESINKILRANKKKELKKRRHRFKTLLVAAVIGALLLTAGTAAIGYDEYDQRFIFWKLGIDSFEPGDVVTYGNVEFRHYRTVGRYYSAEEFYEATDWDVLYPSVWPDKTFLREITLSGVFDEDKNYSEEYPEIDFSANILNVYVKIHTDPVYCESFALNPDLRVEIIGDYCCNIYTDDHGVYAEFRHGGFVYKIKAKTYTDVETIITNLKEYK